YLPENIDSTKKYPLLVYYYERNSENLFRHQHPSPSRSVINKTFYSSNGYIVFVPDIVYKVGYPGHSAYEAVISGTQYLLNKYPFINKNKMGLQGQSWGGYQTAWLITRTSMFAAAMAGAPVSNMSSAYGGIRWQTGLSRMFQYEHQQSRIGGSLWEKPLHYIENSPLFYAPDINTPLLMMHNDNDGAVPWYQGIELFVALRRLDKPVWLLNYNGEPHNLKDTSWANRIDLSTRMFQFFNHFLKNQPLPEWMDKGVPAIKKGEELGY
ncbi:MAG: prolyl oligopeptidase family serine peptidase, partial [Prolixibacteraceae bacterium]|nr:prolyl oligopeptidase family serine peptidase [Prolixibacteraceae bacterium]